MQSIELRGESFEDALSTKEKLPEAPRIEKVMENDGETFVWGNSDGNYIYIDSKLMGEERLRTIDHETYHHWEFKKGLISYRLPMYDTDTSGYIWYVGTFYPMRHSNTKETEYQVKFEDGWYCTGDCRLPWEHNAHAYEDNMALIRKDKLNSVFNNKQ